MRVWLLCALVALAGCTASPEDEDEETRWTPCPQWISSGETVRFDQAVDGNATAILEPAATFQGRPLDLLSIDAGATGPVEVRFSVDGKRLAIKPLPDGDSRPFLSLDGGNASFQVFLSAVAHGAPAAEGPVTVEVTGTGHVTVEALAWYRVCGVPA